MYNREGKEFVGCGKRQTIFTKEEDSAELFESYFNPERLKQLRINDLSIPGVADRPVQPRMLRKGEEGEILRGLGVHV